MRPLCLSLFVALLLPLPACEDGAASGVSDAEARQLCRDSCEKAEECFMAGVLETCLEGCEGSGGNDTDNSCTPAEERAIVDHFKDCNAGPCDDYLACVQSAPACGG